MPLQPSSAPAYTAEPGLEEFFKAAARTAADIATLIRWKNSLARSRPAVQAAFIKWRNLVALEVIRGMNRNPSLRQDTATIVDNLTDWPALEEKARAIFEKTFVRIFEDAAAAELPEIAKGLTIPKVSPASIAAYNWSYRNSAKLVTEITADQRNAIKAIIQSGGLAGTSVKTMASKIRPTIGLHSSRIAAVDKYRAGLEAKGLGKSQVDKLVNQRTAKELRLRAEMIARTETAKARMEGVLFQHKKMGITQVRWLADPECCGECLARSGKIYSIAEASGQIPLHPKCECHFVAATAADLKQSPSWPFTGEPPAKMPKVPRQPAEPKPKKPKPEKTPARETDPLDEWAGKIGYDDLPLERQKLFEDEIRALLKNYKVDLRFIGTNGSDALKNLSSLSKRARKELIDYLKTRPNTSGVHFPGYDVIIIRNDIYTTAAARENRWALRSGWHLSGDAGDTLRHEFGHAVDRKYSISRDPGFRKDVEELEAKWGKKIWSKYAKSYEESSRIWKEQFAEMFSAYTNPTDPSSIGSFPRAAEDFRKLMAKHLPKPRG